MFGGYSRFFLINKKDHVLNLMGLSFFLKICNFILASLILVLQLLIPGDWFTGLNLQGVYFHISIHISILNFKDSHWLHDPPFCLGHSLQGFTKVSSGQSPNIWEILHHPFLRQLTVTYPFWREPCEALQHLHLELFYILNNWVLATTLVSPPQFQKICNQTEFLLLFSR